MTCEVTSRDTLQLTYIEGDFVSFVQELNICAAQGKHFMIAYERGHRPIALEIRNITVVREVDDDAFIG
jgi:hypothetical protein